MKDAAAVKAEYIDKLGPELGEVFNALWQEVAWLHSVWEEFEELYATSKERIELLNRTAPFFFHFVQQELWHGVLIRIRKLTDPAETRKKQNLTICRLPGLCDEPVRSKVQHRVETALEAAMFARDWGNRHVAHLDLDLALGRPAVPLPGVSKAATREALAAIHDVLNCISMELMDAEMHATPIHGPDGAETLLYLLQDGLDLQQYRRDARTGGDTVPETLQRRRRPSSFRGAIAADP